MRCALRSPTRLDAPPGLRPKPLKRTFGRHVATVKTLPTRCPHPSPALGMQGASPEPGAAAPQVWTTRGQLPAPATTGQQGKVIGAGTGCRGGATTVTLLIAMRPKLACVFVAMVSIGAAHFLLPTRFWLRPPRQRSGVGLNRVAVKPRRRRCCRCGALSAWRRTHRSGASRSTRNRAEFAEGSATRSGAHQHGRGWVCAAHAPTRTVG